LNGTGLTGRENDGMFKLLLEDVRTVFEKDPAVRSVAEVLFCYPGVHALWMHRIAHRLYRRRLFFWARLVSHISRFLTGVEIHPGATIGRRVFIDHGMGVVIGETAVVGDGSLIYAGVVLGGTSLDKGKRHPTIGRNVVIGSGAIVLGNITIGDNARIGGGSVVLKSVPAGSTAVGVPARVGIGFTPEQLNMLEHDKLPDPIADGFAFVLKEVGKIEERLRRIESLEGVSAQTDDELEKKKRQIAEVFDAEQR